MAKSVERKVSFINPGKVMIPVDGSEASSLAAEFAKGVYPNADKKPVNVIEVPRRLPLDAELPIEVKRGESILNNAEEIVNGDHHKHPGHNEGELLQARDAAPAVIAEAVKKDVSTILIGFDGQHEGPGTGLGHFAEHILNHFPGQVVIFRAQIENPHTPPPAQHVR